MKQIKMQLKLQKKPHTIGENLTKPCSLKIVEFLFGKEKKKIAAVSLSNSTIQKRIEDMAADIKDQVAQGSKSAAFRLFSIQMFPVNGFCKVCPFKRFQRGAPFSFSSRKNYENCRHL